MTTTMPIHLKDPDGTAFTIDLHVGDYVFCDGLDTEFGEVIALYPAKASADVSYPADGEYVVEARVITHVKHKGVLVERPTAPAAAMATPQAEPKEAGADVYPGGLVVWDGPRAEMTRNMRKVGAKRLYVVLNYTKGALRETHVNIMPLNSMIESAPGWANGSYASVPRKWLKPVRLGSYDR